MDKAKPKVSRIYASNDIVIIEDENGAKRSVTIEEALHRAQAVVTGIAPHLPADDKSRSLDLVDELVLAADAAKKNRDGHGFATKLIDGIRIAAKSAGNPGSITV